MSFLCQVFRSRTPFGRDSKTFDFAVLKNFTVFFYLVAVFGVLWGTAVHAAAPAPPSALTILGQTRISKDTTPIFRVTTSTTGGTVTLYSNSGCTDAISAAATVSSRSLPHTVDILTTVAFTTDGEKTIYAQHTNATSESSTCAAFARAYKLDATAPVLSVSATELGNTITATTTYTDINKPSNTDFNVNALLKTFKISDNGGGDGKLNVDLGNRDFFGSSVALDGNTLAVGVPQYDGYESNSGAVYLFTKENGTWTQTFKIAENTYGERETHVSSLGQSDLFGSSVALDGDILAVGAPSSRSNGAGKVYVFIKNNTTWTVVLKISNNLGRAGELDVNELAGGDKFGSSVALDGNTLAVGAAGDDDGNTDHGAVYLFTKNGTAWTNLTKTLKISENAGAAGYLAIDLKTSDYFGSSVALDGNTLVVGATGDDDGGAGSTSNSGGVYLFARNGSGVWSNTLKISRNTGLGARLKMVLDDGDEFGSSVALAGNTLAVGAWGDDDGGANSTSDKGAVYLFTKEGTAWSRTLKISNKSDGGNLNIALDNGDYFGFSVAFDGTTLVAGARYDDDGVAGNNNRGAAYLFDASAMRYAVQVGNSCTVTPSQTSLPYTENTPILFTPAENKHFCFWAADKAGNQGVFFDIKPTVLTATLDAAWAPAGVANSKTLAVSGVTAGATATYKILESTVPCTATAYSANTATEETLSLSSGSGSITISSEVDNTKYACVKLSKTNFSDHYFQSSAVTGIDSTAPTISSAVANNTFLTVTMNEAIYAATTPDNADFTIAPAGVTVTKVANLSTTADSAHTSFTLTLSGVLTSSPTLSYAPNTDSAKKIKDKFGNFSPSLSHAINVVAISSVLSVDLLNQSSVGSNTRPTFRVIVSDPVKGGAVTLYSDSACINSISSPKGVFDIVAPEVVFSPASGSTITDNTQNIMLLFSEPIKRDGSGGALINVDLSGILTLKVGSSDGADIPHTATISADKMSITLDPTAPLSDGVVYVDAFSSGHYYDAAGNRGTLAGFTFTVASASSDTVAPTVRFFPENSATIADSTQNITLLFSEPIKKDGSGGALADADLSGILTLKAGSSTGTDIPHTATISADKMRITLDPTAPLSDGAVYVAVSNGYYDAAAAANQGIAVHAVFAVEDIAPPIVDVPVTSPFSGDGEKSVYAKYVHDSSSSACSGLFASGRYVLDTVAPVLVPPHFRYLSDFGTVTTSYTDLHKASTTRLDVNALFNTFTITEDAVPSSRGNFFGSAVDFDDTMLVIGVPGDSSDDKGAVYIFNQDADGKWLETLKISDAPAVGELGIVLDADDKFGSSVALDGNTLAVGAPGDDDGGTDSGAMYIFTKSAGVDGTWSKTLKISNNHSAARELGIVLDAGDGFGSSAALDGNTLAIGVPGDDDTSTDTGAVYLFTKSAGVGGTWSKTLKISDNDAVSAKLDVVLYSGGAFGSSVALDGNTLAVGAPRDNSGGRVGEDANAHGAVYLFAKSSGNWQKSVKIVDDFNAEDGVYISLKKPGSVAFGSSVALDGAMLAVGERYDGTYGKGAVYLFTKVGATWKRVLKISDNDSAAGELDISLSNNIQFGSSVAFNGNTLAVGGSSSSAGEGSVYFFESKIAYKVQTSNSCTSAPPVNSLPTKSGVVTFTSRDNGKYVCFWAKDLAGNIDSTAATQIREILPPAFVAFASAWVPEVPAISKNITFEFTDSNVTNTEVAYKILPSVSLCNEFGYSASTSVETALPLVGTSSPLRGSITVANESDNNKYACLKISQPHWNWRGDRYFVSPLISGIDITAGIDSVLPRITSVTLNENNNILTVTMNEPVYARITPLRSSFTVVWGTDSSEISIRKIQGLSTTPSAAGDTFTLSLSQPLTAAAVLKYVVPINFVPGRRIKDIAENILVSGVEIAFNSTITAGAIATDNFINAVEVNSDVAIGGSFSGFTVG